MTFTGKIGHAFAAVAKCFVLTVACTIFATYPAKTFASVHDNSEISAAVTFPIAKADVDPAFDENAARLDSLCSALKRAQACDKRISNIIISGYTSPDGNISTNRRLANRRALNTKAYLRELLTLPDTLFTIGPSDINSERMAGIRCFLTPIQITNAQATSEVDETPVPEEAVSEIEEPSPVEVHTTLLESSEPIESEITETTATKPGVA